MVSITAERLKKGISAALGQPTAVTRRGRTVAVMIPPGVWERVQALEGANETLPAEPVVLGDDKPRHRGRLPATVPLPSQVANTEHSWHELACARCQEPIGAVVSFDLTRNKTPLYCRDCGEWTKSSCLHCGQFIGTSPTPHGGPVMFCLQCAGRDSAKNPEGDSSDSELGDVDLDEMAE